MTRFGTLAQFLDPWIDSKDFLLLDITNGYHLIVNIQRNTYKNLQEYAL